MGNLKKSLEYQQKINEITDRLVTHLTEEMSLAEYYERMAKTQALMMMTMGMNCKGDKIDLPKDVAFFFDDIRILLEYLRPLSELGADKDDSDK